MKLHEAFKLKCEFDKYYAKACDTCKNARICIWICESKDKINGCE